MRHADEQRAQLPPSDNMASGFSTRACGAGRSICAVLGSRGARRAGIFLVRRWSTCTSADARGSGRCSERDSTVHLPSHHFVPAGGQRWPSAGRHRYHDTGAACGGTAAESHAGATAVLAAAAAAWHVCTSSGGLPARPCNEYAANTNSVSACSSSAAVIFCTGGSPLRCRHGHGLHSVTCLATVRHDRGVLFLKIPEICLNENASPIHHIEKQRGLWGCQASV